MTIAAPEAPSKRKFQPSVVQSLGNQTAAAKMLLTQLKAIGVFGDDVAVHDAIEGETNLFEALTDAVRRTGELKAFIAALEAQEKEIKERRQRLSANEDAIYAAIAVAMDAVGEKKCETAFGTISVRPGNPKVIVTEEAYIPAKFWVPQDPKLDKTAVKKALQEKEVVPGAHLSNGEAVVSIRRA